MARPPQLSTLLRIDCVAAGLAGVAMLGLGGVVSRLLGLPVPLVRLVGVTNLVYGTFSASLATRRSPPARLVQLLVAGNLAWAGVCAVLSVAMAADGSWLGALYLLGEGVFVGALGLAERWSARQAVAPR